MINKFLRRMRPTALVLAVVLTAGVMFSLEPIGAAPAAPGGKVMLRIAIGGHVANMDVMRDGNAPTNAVLGHIVETLLAQDEKGNIIPYLATSWTVSKEDPTVWTFKLRPGVTFHDGSPLNAEAVAASFRRLINPNFKLDRGVQYYNLLASATALDEMTVQLKTKEPWGVLPTFLTYVASAVVGPSVANQERITVPIGTGPFKFVEWKPGEFVRLAKNEKYWGEGPYGDEVVISEVPEDGTRIAKLLAGEVDLITDVPPQEAERLRQDRNITILNDPTDRVMWIQFNVRKKPFDGRDVRKAIKYAIDVDAISRGILKGVAQPADSLAAPGVFGYAPDPGYHEYNRDKARELLAKAGYANGFETSITYAVGRYPLQQEIVTAIQAQLAQVGIKARLNPLEDGVYRVTTRKPLQDNPLEMNITAWSSVVGDVSFLIGAVFVPPAIPPSCCNTMFWENRGVVDLYRASLEQTDINKRLGQLRTIQQIVNQEVPQVHLFVYRQITAQTARLAGVRVPPNQHWYVGRVRFTR